MSRQHATATRVAIAVIERRGRYLICRRRAGAFLGGCWEFPGGKHEAGESWESCLRRELREELGVTVKGVAPIGGMRHRYAGRSIAFRVFRCEIAGGTPRPLQARQLRWVPRKALAAYRFPPANRGLIARLVARPLEANPGHARGARPRPASNPRRQSRERGERPV